MRPNIDVPWDTHGEIKQYSDQTDQSIEEAYLEVLKNGLKRTGDRQQRLSFDEPSDIHFSRINEKLGVGHVVLFSDFSTGMCDESVVIRVKERNIPVEEAEGILASLRKYFPLDEGAFSIHQKNAGWYGSGGIEQFIYRLQNLDHLYQEIPDGFELDRHRAASAAYVGWTAHPAQQILVYATLNSSGKLEEFGIEFIIDGYPVGPGKFGEFADSIGMSLSHAKPWGKFTDLSKSDNIERQEIGEDGPVKIIEKIYDENNDTMGSQSIKGLVCQNPFYEDPKMATNEFSDLTRPDSISGVERLYGELQHTVDEDMDYNLFVRRLVIRDIGVATDAPFGISTINFVANW